MIVSAVLSAWLISTCVNSAAESPASSAPGEANFRRFAARGVVKELKADGSTILLSHEAITNYMDAMTMPFKVKEPKELTDLRPGDQVSFRLSVSNTESWIDQVVKITAAAPPSPPLDVFSGVRPSSAAATSASSSGSDCTNDTRHPCVSAPEDGRTPLNTYPAWPCSLDILNPLRSHFSLPFPGTLSHTLSELTEFESNVRSRRISARVAGF